MYMEDDSNNSIAIGVAGDEAKKEKRRKEVVSKITKEMTERRDEYVRAAHLSVYVTYAHAHTGPPSPTPASDAITHRPSLTSTACPSNSPLDQRHLQPTTYGCTLSLLNAARTSPQ